MFRFHIVVFGCKVNQYESQAIREYWQSLGASECENPEEADLVLAATCAVTAEAVGDARQAVRKFGSLSAGSLSGGSGAGGKAGGPAVIVTGCAASAAAAEFALPGVLAVIPQQAKHILLARHPLEDDLGACLQALPPGQGALFPPFRIRSFQRARPVIKVQDGCSHACVYCIVPLTRGQSRSRDPREALEEAERLLEAGHRELIISGINLRQYRYQGQDFWDLLATLDRNLAPEYAGRARLRLSSLDPAQLDAKGLDCLAACRLLCPHLHLSLQSGSPSLLERMGRAHYRTESVLEGLDLLRRHWPVFGLGADILTGFPGESEAELEETLALVEALPLSYAHVFPYSARPGTKAASLPGHLPKALRQERARRVRELAAAKSGAFLRDQLALPECRLALDLLPYREKTGKDGKARQCTGVNEYYAPCVLEGAIPKDCELVRAVPSRLEQGRIYALVRTG